MEIRSGTVIANLMFYWPFLISGLAILFFITKLSLGRLVLLFGTGILVGYGVSMFLIMPITMLLMPMASIFVPRETLGMLTLVVHILGSALFTGFVLWVLGRSLRVQDNPLPSRDIQTATILGDTSPFTLGGNGASTVVQGQLKESDYVSAQLLHFRPSPVFAVIALVALVALVVWTLIHGYSLIVLASLICIVWTYTVYIGSRHTFRQYKALSEPVTMEVREEGLFFKRTNGEGLVPWSDIIKWRNNKKLVLLYPAENLFHMIPSHFFASSEKYHAFLATLGAKLGKAT